MNIAITDTLQRLYVILDEIPMSSEKHENLALPI